MGLQSDRWRTLNYVPQTGLKKLLAAPRVQQEPVIWSSRHVVHNVISFLFLLRSHTVFRSTIPAPNAGFVPAPLRPLPGRQGRPRGVGAPTTREAAGARIGEHPSWLTCHVAESKARLSRGCPRRGFHSQLQCPLWSLFFQDQQLLGTKQQVEPVSNWYLQIFNLHVQSGARLWVICPWFFCLLLGHSYWHRKK